MFFFSFLFLFQTMCSFVSFLVIFIRDIFGYKSFSTHSSPCPLLRAGVNDNGPSSGQSAPMVVAGFEHLPANLAVPATCHAERTGPRPMPSRSHGTARLLPNSMVNSVYWVRLFLQLLRILLMECRGEATIYSRLLPHSMVNSDYWVKILFQLL
jgi:hypothetical protein